jgi:hypothetical protein
MKLLPALGAIASVFGLIACSSTVPASDGAKAEDAGPGTDAIATDAAVGADAAKPDDVGPLACPPDTTGYEPLVNAPPRARQGACTGAEVDELVHDCLKSGDRWLDPACTGHTSACARCMRSKGSEPTWGAIVELQEGGDTGWVPNQAGCIDHLTGMPGCGDRITGFGDCTSFACDSERCKRAEDRADCSDRASRVGTCAALVPSSECNLAYAEKAKSCVASGESGFRTVLKAFCQSP